MGKFSQEFFSFDAQRGRIKIAIIGRRIGNDFWLLVHGGESHVGAAALAGPQAAAQYLQQPGHRDGDIALEVAATLRDALGGSISVTCGIHFDQITREEIALVRSLAAELAQKVIAAADRQRRNQAARLRRRKRPRRKLQPSHCDYMAEAGLSASTSSEGS